MIISLLILWLLFRKTPRQEYNSLAKLQHFFELCKKIAQMSDFFNPMPLYLIFLLHGLEFIFHLQPFVSKTGGGIEIKVFCRFQHGTALLL